MACDVDYGVKASEGRSLGSGSHVVEEAKSLIGNKTLRNSLTPQLVDDPPLPLIASVPLYA